MSLPPLSIPIAPGFQYKEVPCLKIRIDCENRFWRRHWTTPRRASRSSLATDRRRRHLHMRRASRMQAWETPDPDARASGRHHRPRHYPTMVAGTPWANIGIVMGNASGVFVVESDPRNGGDETMAGLIAEHGSLPTTPTVKSGGGGEHRYYRLPPGVSVKSKPIAKGIDAKGSGLVIAPPSMHASGNRYIWVSPSTHPSPTPPIGSWRWRRRRQHPPRAAMLRAQVASAEATAASRWARRSPATLRRIPEPIAAMRNDTMCRLWVSTLAGVTARRRSKP